MSRIARLDREFGVDLFLFFLFFFYTFFFLPTRRSSNVVARCFLRKGGDRAIERIERSWDTYPCSGRYQRVIVHLCGWFYSFLIGQVGIQRDDRIYLDLKSETNFNITNFLFILLSKLKIYIYIYTSFPFVSPLSNHSTVTVRCSQLIPETTAEWTRPETN